MSHSHQNDIGPLFPFKFQTGDPTLMKAKTKVKVGIYISLTLSGGKTSGPATDTASAS